MKIENLNTYFKTTSVILQIFLNILIIISSIVALISNKGNKGYLVALTLGMIFKLALNVTQIVLTSIP